MMVPDSLANICADNVVPDVQFDDNGNVVFADYWAKRLNHDFIENVTMHMHLRHLSFAYSSFSDSDCVHLQKLPNLEWLSLHETAVKGSGIEHLLNLSHLNHLDLFGCPLSSDAYCLLPSCKTLRTLILSRTPVTDSDLFMLSSMKQLEMLYIRYTDITEDAALELEKVLPKCTIKRFAYGAPSARGR